MKRDSKTENEKKILAIYREYDELRRNRKGTWENIEPFQRGWYRYFVIRDDIKLRPDVQHIRRILDKINVVKDCRRKDFTYMNYKTKKREPIPQFLRTLDEASYVELNEKDKSYFMSYWEYPKKHEHWKKPVLRYMFRFSYFFVFEIKPRIITKRWIQDGEWATRIAELENKLFRDDLWTKLWHIKGESQYNDWLRRPEYDKFDIRGEMDDLIDDMPLSATG